MQDKYKIKYPGQDNLSRNQDHEDLKISKNLTLEILRTNNICYLTQDKFKIKNPGQDTYI